MKELPHGCNCSEPTVNPKHFEKATKNDLKKDWYIQYYFYDPAHDKPKYVVVKGMNSFKTVLERIEATKVILDNELYMLEVEGYNPITKEFRGRGSIDPSGEIAIDGNAPVTEAIKYIVPTLDISDNTKADIKNVSKYFNESLIATKNSRLRISDIKRRNIHTALNYTAIEKGYSNDRFNKMRSYIMMIFKRLNEFDIIESNPVVGIPKRKTVKRLRKHHSPDQVERIKNHLEKNYYTFYRYLIIFFHSGCRSTELFRLQVKHVDIASSSFMVTVIKGGKREEQLRGINKNVLHLWKELLEGSKPNDFVFSKGLETGKKKISERQITIRYNRHVKEKLNIDVDFYAFKHLHTTKVIELYGRDLASNINGHSSNLMNDRHYDIMKSERLLKASKNLDLDL